MAKGFPIRMQNPPPLKKPPLGIVPWRFWLEQRKEEIESAIIRYSVAELSYPKEWVCELQSIYAMLKD